MNWWMEVMPVEGSEGETHSVSYQRQTRAVAVGGAVVDPKSSDRVMLIRNRKSRIYFLRQFFDYPIQLTADTLKGLGLVRTIKSASATRKAWSVN